MTLGQMIAGGMKEQQLNARQLGEAIGYADYRRIYDWTRDQRPPGTEVLRRLVEVLGLDPQAAYLALHEDARWFFEGARLGADNDGEAAATQGA